MTQLVINFDLIILLLLIFCSIKGVIRGVFGQIRSTFMVTVPLIALFMMKKTILTTLAGISIYTKIVGIAFKGLRFVFVMTEEYFFNLFSYALILAVASLVVFVLFQIISPSRKRRILAEKKTASRVIGGVLGAVNGYMCIFIMFLVFATFANFSVTTGITKIFVNFHKDLLANLMM